MIVKTKKDIQNEKWKIASKLAAITNISTQEVLEAIENIERKGEKLSYKPLTELEGLLRQDEGSERAAGAKAVLDMFRGATGETG